MDASGRSPPSAQESPVDFKAIYERGADFVWLTLQRLGIRSADLEDVCHDVFLIAHRKIDQYDRQGKVNSWLFGICVRVAANYRRRAHIRLERSDGGVQAELTSGPAWSQPDRDVAARAALAEVETALRAMSPVRRVVFVMFEVEGMSCDTIARELGLPVGTVYSRLHAARQFLLERFPRTDPAKGGSKP